MVRCVAEVYTFSSVKISCVMSRSLLPSLAHLPLAHLELHANDLKFTSELLAFSHGYVMPSFLPRHLLRETLF